MTKRQDQKPTPRPAELNRRRILQSAVLASGGLLLEQFLTQGRSQVSRGLTREIRAAGTEEAVQSRALNWLSDVQRRPEKLPADAPQLAPLLTSPTTQPIRDVESWVKRREALRTEWRALLGDLGVSREKLPACETIRETTSDGVITRLIRYDSEPGWPTEAYILEPTTAAPTAGRPAAAIFHSTVDHSILQPAGLAGPSSKHFGLRLARRGFTCICPRNFLWPDNEHIQADAQTKKFAQLHPRATGMAKMLHDAQLALDLLIAQPQVDKRRVAAIGHSLGAKEVLYLAALDDRVKVTVSSEGGIGTKFSNWNAPWYLGAALERFAATREHHELLALIAPRPFLLLGGDSADGDRSWPFIESALPVYQLYGEPPALGLLNHQQGHSVPPIAEQRIDEWVLHYT